jgi:hypothetical protein
MIDPLPVSHPGRASHCNFSVIEPEGARAPFRVMPVKMNFERALGGADPLYGHDYFSYLNETLTLAR